MNIILGPEEPRYRGTPAPVQRGLLPFWIGFCGGAVAIALLLSFMLVARAAWGQTTLYQVWVKYADEKTWVPWISSKHNFVARLTPSKESCKLDLVEATRDVPSGSLITCATLGPDGITFGR